MGSTAVNVPTDLKVKEKDVNAKLQLYGIYAAFANGKVPSNKQIDVAMNTALEWQHLTKPSSKLSADGQKLVADLRTVIEQSKQLLLSKNDGNLLQSFIWQTEQITAGDAQGVNAPLDKDTAKQHGNQAVDGLRTLGQLLITNGQFRKLLNDAVVLFRDIAGDAAQKTAAKVNPSEDQLNQLDQPAEDNTWHEAPDLSTGNLKKQLQDQIPISKKEANKVAGDVTQAAHPSGSRDPQEAADLAAQEQQTGQSTGLDAKAGIQTGAAALKNNVNENMDEDKKRQMREYRQRTREYFKNKVPKERRDQVIFRLKKMIVEIQGHRDYQQAIETLLRLAEEYGGHTKNVASQGQGAVKGAHSQDSLQSAEANLKTLLERFANNTSFDDLFDAINQIYVDADRDPELKGFFKDTDRFIRKCLQEQGYILQDESNEAWDRLYDRGNFLLRDRYRSHSDRIVDEIKFLADQFEQDPQNKAFKNSMDKLFQDLGNDNDGQPEFKPHLIKDLTEVLIPAFFEHVRYVPIPRIEFSDPMVDVIVENLVLEGDNLAPNQFEFGSDNYWSWSRKMNKSNKNKNKVMLAVSGVQMDIRDVSYYVKKKQGFPGITDKGVMDIFLGGTGLSFKVAMETADKNTKDHFFKINTVSVDIKNMNIKLKQSNHKLLFGLFKPLLFKVIRPALQKVIEQQIRENVRQLDSYLFAVKQEVDRVTEEAKNNPDPENIQNIYQRYFNAFQKKMAQANKKKEKAKEAAADKHVNVAITQQDSIFKSIALPGGISTKATEYKELAAKGDAWESPVFGIGSAKESTNVPRAGQPTRKPHSTAQSAVKPATNGFANQVNDAFQPTQGGAFGLSESNQSVTGSGQTTLGRDNPVLSGKI